MKPKARSRAATLQEKGRRYRNLLKHLPVGVYRTTPEGRIVEANEALAEMLGYTLPELMAAGAQSLYVNGAERDRELRRLAREPGGFAEIRLRRKDGKAIWGRDYSEPVFARDGTILCYDGILVDITAEKRGGERLKAALASVRRSNRERKKMIARLRDVTITDDLTGLRNRRGFFLLAEQQLKLALRRSARLYLLFLDLDNLKRINDSLGHRVGDQALIEMARILERTFRTSDAKGRMGGDEFAVFPIDAALDGVESAMARLRLAIEDFNDSGTHPFKLSVSAGIAGFDPAHPTTVEDLLVRADKLMYEEKQKKR